MKRLAVAVLALTTLFILSCSEGDNTSQARIAFISDRDGNSELYVMNTDGSGLKRLTDTEADEWYPSWSPDGRRIAFLAETPGLPLYKVFVVDADGSNLTEVVGTNQPSSPVAYSWSPDGSKLALELSLNGESSVYVVNVDGTGLTDLAPGPRPAQSFDPRWSPDGSRIVFWGQNGADRALFFANPDGSDLTRFSEDGTRASWSPNGTKLGYMYSVPGSGTSATHIMNPDGSELVNLTEILDMRLLLPSMQFGRSLVAWSPDSRMIAFGSDDEGDLDLYTTTIDGMELVRLTEGLGVGESLFTQIVWSPDGSKIALATSIGQRFSPDEIYVVNTDGSGYENVTNTGNDMDRIIAWSADSSQIFFVAGHGEPVEGTERLLQVDFDIFVMNADGSGVENLSDRAVSDVWPAPALWLPE